MFIEIIELKTEIMKMKIHHKIYHPVDTFINLKFQMIEEKILWLKEKIIPVKRN